MPWPIGAAGADEIEPSVVTDVQSSSCDFQGYCTRPQILIYIKILPKCKIKKAVATTLNTHILYL